MLISAVAAMLAVQAPPPAAPMPPSVAGASTTADPQRLALARTTVDRIFPPGSYGQMMTQMMGTGMDSAMSGMLDMTPEQMGVPTTDKNKADAKVTLREQVRKNDPHFEERMRITSRVMGEEMGRIGAKIEPSMRAGLTTALAQRFTAAQLTDINGFLATPSGQAFGSQFLLIWFDPALMKSIMGSMPEMMREMPAIGAKLEAATAHLPKPKCAKSKDKETD